MFNFLHTTIPHSVFIQIGPLTIRYYGLFLLLAILAALFLIIKIASWYDIKKDTIIDLSIYLLIGGIIGARIYDIFLELPYYINHPLQMVQIWKGGLAIHGGLLGGFLALYIFTKKYKISILKLSAVIVPGLALGQAIGRWGNWFNQELFGLPSTSAWSIPINYNNRPAAYLNYNFFEPTFLYESLACLLLACILFFLHWHWYKNISEKKLLIIISSYLSAYAFIRFMLEFIKIDYTPIFFGLRWPQIASLIMILLAIMILDKKNFKSKKI